MVAPVTPPRINTPLRNYFFYKLGEKTGQVLADGYLIFYTEATYPTGFLTVYEDPDLTIPYTTTSGGQVGLGDDGGIAPIYMQDIAYAIECYSVEGDLQFTVRNYLGALFIDGGGGGGSDAKTPNLFPDGQFNYPIFDGAPPIATTAITSTDWVFQKDGSGGTDILEFIRFPLGDTDVPQTPLNMLHYQVTSAPSGETIKRFYFPFSYVRTLETQEVTISFYARGTGSSTITPFYEQYFGSSATGGPAPSLTNTVALSPLSLTGTWTEYQQTFTIDTASGKTLGNNDNDQLRVGVNFSLNGTTNVFITNMLLEEGATATQYPYITDNEIESSQNSINPPGMISAFGRYTPPVGWLKCDGAATARNIYINLFEACSVTLNGDTTNGGDTVSNVDTTNLAGGSYITQDATTTSGSAVLTDLDVTQLVVGMYVSNENFASLVTIDSIDIGASTVTVTGGTATDTGTVETDFYYNLGTEFTSSQFTGVVSILKKINSTSFKASANATASGTTGILFYMYGGGDGITTFNVPNYNEKAIVGSGGTDWARLSNGLGAYGGSRTNTMTEGELKPHIHGVGSFCGAPIGNFLTGAVDRGGSTDVTSSTGGGTPSNIIQPSLTSLICIKT